MNRSVIIFVAIIAAAFVLVSLFLTVGKAVPLVFWFVGLLAFVVVAVLFPKLVEFREYERGVVFRFGKVSKVVGPGLAWIFPAIESYALVDLRTQVIDMKPQEVVTKDNVRVKVDAIIYTRTTDPVKAVTKVKDYKTAMSELLRANIRAAVARLSLEEVIEKTEEINNLLFAEAKKVADEWGVSVLRVEIQSVELPPELIEAMHKRKEALEYKAKAETEALARQVSLEILDKAASKMSDKTLAYLYLDALKKISEGRSNKIIFPLELSHLASMLSGKLAEQEKKGEIEGKPDYEQILAALQEAYTQKKREILDEAPSAAAGVQEEKKVAPQPGGESLEDVKRKAVARLLAGKSEQSIKPTQ
ncbi:MAG: SPFH domain-containing protein [Candidatus Micrarchaeia archaeon]|jgi:regulator of protease activity HflC (stomatin/prohibitin superfamily)